MNIHYEFLFKAFINCSSDDQEPVIIYVSKLFSVNNSALSQNIHKYDEPIFFSRLNSFSGIDR